MRYLLAVVAVAVVLISAPAQAAPCAGFTDVDDTSPFCASVEWMKNRGITSGVTATQYDPYSPVTRLQMAAFMYRLGFQNTFLTGGNTFGGTAVLGTTDEQPLDIRVNGSRVMRYEPATISPNVIGGHATNSAIGSPGAATVAGGGLGGANCYEPSTGTYTRLCANRASNYATVGGGASNSASGLASTIAGGSSNSAGNSDSTVAGGQANTASGPWSTVAGRYSNTASGTSSTVAGGAFNTASGSNSFAAGRRAKATTNGTFMWADASDFDFAPSVNNFFGARATGGVGFTVQINGSGAPTQFCNYLPGYSGWSCTSDRNAKENFASVEGSEILEKLMAMPVYTYNFKGADPALRMLGPTAQDFHAAFGLGDSDTTIASGNIHGVALAAIQGLNAKLDERESALRAEVQAKDAEIAALRSESDALKRDIADLRLAVEVLMARTSGEGRVAQTR